MNQFAQNYEPTDEAMPIACAPHVGRITDEKWLRLMHALLEATEQVRERLRLDEFWGMHVELPPRGLLSMAVHTVTKPRVRASYLSWPALLTMEPDCLADVCRLAQCTQDELIGFVLFICPYEHRPHMEQFFSNEAALKRIVKAISAEVQPMKAKQVRIRKGASTGGQKSAVTRAKAAKAPTAEVLQHEVMRLIATGKLESEVAGILAVKYGVTPKTIRLKLRQARKLG